jgi:hypothetical protein
LKATGTGNKMSRTRAAIARSSRTAIENHGIWQESRNRDGVNRWRKRLDTTVRVLAPLVLLLVAGYILADTAGQRLALSEPERALAIAPWEPIALNALAQRQLANSGELSSVETLARRALLSDPLDGRAISSLAFVAERNGDLTRAETLMSFSGARSWRNPPAHLWLFAQAVRRGKFDEALVQADGLLRVQHWHFQASIFPVLTLFGLYPDGLEALERSLTANPPWRRAFLRQVVEGGNERLTMQLYRFLLRSGQPPTALEMKPYLDRLILVGRFEEAHQDWRATSSQGEMLTRYPYNGNFEAPLDGSPFNWVFDDVGGAEVEITEGADRGNRRALRVQFSGARAYLGRVGQLLMLTPGGYRLELAAKASNLRAERGLVWQVSCAGSGTVLAETTPVTRTAPWTELAVKFSVPPSDCGAQWLRLTIPARTASESEIEGDVWFQNFRITAESH